MDKPQNKPTEEELKAKQEEAVKLAEEIEGKGIPEEEDNEQAPELIEDETQEEELIAETQDEEDEVEPSKELYKKKFSASARENQRIAAKNRVMNQALAQAEDVKEPTNEEMEIEFPDWDAMTDTEKLLAKETVISRNWRKIISQAKDQATKIEKWQESIDSFVDDPKSLIDNPSLEGKLDEFREFALAEANNSVPFNILISAFLHEHSTNKQPNKGRMFPRGKGGSNEKPIPKADKLSLEESKRLRETDYNKWKEYLKNGKIEINI